MGVNQRSQIEMSPDEMIAFVASQRTANLATIGATGQPHLVGMWFCAVSPSRDGPRSSRTPRRCGRWGSTCGSATTARTPEEHKPFVEVMLNKRVAVRFDVARTRSWDHRKLGLDPMPLGGTTAPGHQR